MEGLTEKYIRIFKKLKILDFLSWDDIWNRERTPSYSGRFPSFSVHCDIKKTLRATSGQRHRFSRLSSHTGAAAPNRFEKGDVHMGDNAVTKRMSRLSGRRQKQIKLVLFLLPFMAMVTIFSYIPLFGWSYAFVDYSPGLQLWECEFVGLKYFERIFTNSADFIKVMRNTLAISSLNICCSVLPAIFAIAISQVKYKRFAKVVQTCTSIPNFISWVLVYSIVFMLLSSENSALNNILMGLGLISSPVNPLTDVDHAWAVQVSINVWKTLGYNAIIYLSAITSIDQELYQAADVDGANNWQKILHVTIPGLLSTFFVLLLLAISNMLSNGFDQFWLLGTGMTWDKLEVFDTYVYRMGIRNMEYSLATAMGIFKSVVSILLLSFANFASKRLRGNSIF